MMSSALSSALVPHKAVVVSVVFSSRGDSLQLLITDKILIFQLEILTDTLSTQIIHVCSIEC